MALSLGGHAVAQHAPEPYVQIGDIDIDPAQLESYKAAISEHAETAIRVEPGVLTLYAVSDKNNPTHVRIFEIYHDVAAYKAHLETAHFKKYKATTEKMVTSLKLVQTMPIALVTKSRWLARKMPKLGPIRCIALPSQSTGSSSCCRSSCS